MTTTALAGLRVVEMTEAWAGPVGASLLGDMGADVVKVESYPRSSMTRPVRPREATMPGDGPPYERDALHHQGNRNKRNVCLDVRTEGGAEVLRRLIAGSDLFIEGYSSGTIARLGFGWEAVHQLNPRTCMISLAGWGVAGIYAGKVTLGAGLDATSGHMAVRGYPDGPMEDVRSNFHSDATGAATTVCAAITALEQRERTGEGCFTDFSQWEGLVWQFPGLLGEWTMNGRRPARLGNRDPHVVPHGVYRAAGDDEWVAIAAEDDAQWAALAGALGHGEWAEEPHPWSTLPGRLGAREAVDRAISAATGERAAFDLADDLQAAGAICAPVISSSQVLMSPQLQAREWNRTIEHRWTGPAMVGGFLWQVEPDPLTWDRPTALVGEHNGEVLAELGYSAPEIAGLLRAGAIAEGYPEPGEAPPAPGLPRRAGDS